MSALLKVFKIEKLCFGEMNQIQLLNDFNSSGFSVAQIGVFKKRIQENF